MATRDVDTNSGPAYGMFGERRIIESRLIASGWKLCTSISASPASSANAGKRRHSHEKLNLMVLNGYIDLTWIMIQTLGLYLEALPGKFRKA